MRNRNWLAAAPAALLLSGILFAQTTQTPQHPAAAAVESVPPYHDGPPKGPLAPTLPASDFNEPVTAHCYAAAAQIKSVLYQLPCYCHCDKNNGHTSLLSCYQDRHTAGCGTCKMELYYAYLETQRGKTAAEIRKGIISGDWKKVDIAGWPGPAPAAKPDSR